MSESEVQVRGEAARLEAAANPFPVEALRARFPALRDAGDREIFFDNAAGAQVPDTVLEAMREHLTLRNMNRGARYARSEAVDRQIHETRSLIAAHLNAAAPEEILFGLNSTNLMRTIAEAARPLFRPGDRVVVTQLDHEANVGPWLRLEKDGVVPVVWPVRNPGARLDPEDLERILREGKGRVKLIALPLASNAIGRVVDVAAAARLAREAGALTFVDSVHYGPHGAIDARALGVDFLAFSGYKIFGPHLGFLWGRREVLQSLTPAREFFIPADPPYGFEGGTQNFEAIAGTAATMRYLASVGMDRIRAYEGSLTASLLETMRAVPGISILGDSDPALVAERVPTVAFTIAGVTPRSISERLGALGIQARDGHMYAPRLIEACGIDPSSGVARVSLCHYNTPTEIARFGEALRSLV